MRSLNELLNMKSAADLVPGERYIINALDGSRITSRFGNPFLAVSIETDKGIYKLPGYLVRAAQEETSNDYETLEKLRASLIGKTVAVGSYVDSRGETRVSVRYI